MEKKYYTARKLKPANRESWVLEYRHPLLPDEKGKPGRKIRIGLGTRDEVFAEQLVTEMNELLSNEIYWKPSSKLTAKNLFNSGIVNSFYSEIEYVIKDYKQKRNELIPLKTLSDGYSTVLLLGSTGAGKTTLLRRIMGTDPLNEKFPATSTAKTTVFDTEIILAAGSYKAVVTFYTESETRELIKDSIKNAMKKFDTTKNEKDTLRIFLEDEDQRFRLSYILGKIKEKKRFAKYEIIDSSEDLSTADILVNEAEQEENERKIKSYLDRIITMTNSIVANSKNKYAPNVNLTEEDQIILEEIIESDILDYEGDDIHELTDEIIEEIKLRFKLLDHEELQTEKFGWPIYWEKESLIRETFIKSLRFFSSNSSHLFGKLLTPLVSGIRVQGPFKPDYLENIPKLIILDGEGLGHIPNTTSNLPSKVIKLFDQSDAIVLVDNAQSPMQAPPYAVIKSASISGHYRKLFICFTHFDFVKGDNLPSIQDKIDHVNSSVDNLLGKLENELGYEVKKYLENQLTATTYFLSNLDEKIIDESRFDFLKDQMIDLINNLEKMSLPIESNSLSPIYDISTILFKIQSAAKGFHQIWDGYLFGSSLIPGIKKAHFTQIKALAKRLGHTSDNEYSFLRPISDFWASFNEQISNFLLTPIDWVPSNPSEEDRLRKIDEIRKKVSSKIFDFAKEHLKDKMLSDWQVAYDYSGLGSAALRANKIESIYGNSVPETMEDMDKSIRLFVKNIMTIINESIIECGGKTTTFFDLKNED